MLADAGQAVGPDPGACRTPGRPLRVLLFSTLYPSSARPGHGVFVETRLRELLATGEIEAKVVAPVPWFYSTHPRHGPRALMAATPRRERRNGIDVHHPRYPLPPRIGQNVAPFALAMGAWPTIRRLIDGGFDFDLIDAHFYYPDGAAAALLARRLGKPLVVTARGSDLNVFGRDAVPRALIRRTGRAADASVAVCRALADTLLGWGTPPSRVHVIRNGVDTRRFHPVPMPTARAQLGLDGEPLLISVGHLVPVKGHELTLEALSLLLPRHPRIHLCLVGDGPLREPLRDRARALGIADRVTFAGAVPNDQLSAWFSAADAMVLASRSEGWANVLLESMACGTPVVATDVGGTGEVVGDSGLGRLVPAGDPAAIAAAIEGQLACPPDRAAVRAYAERFGWAETTSAQLRLFRDVVAVRAGTA